MKLRTILAGVALGAAAVVGPAAAAYATDIPDNVSVAAAMFVDNCDATVDVTIVNVKDKPGRYKVNGGERFTVGAADIRTLDGVATIERANGKRVVTVDSFDTQIQELDVSWQRTVGNKTDSITHIWRAPAGCETPAPIPTPTPTVTVTPTPAPTATASPTPPPTVSAPTTSAPTATTTPVQVVPMSNSSGQGSLPVTGSGMTYVYVGLAAVLVGLIGVVVGRRRGRHSA